MFLRLNYSDLVGKLLFAEHICKTDSYCKLTRKQELIINSCPTSQCIICVLIYLLMITSLFCFFFLLILLLLLLLLIVAEVQYVVWQQIIAYEWLIWVYSTVSCVSYFTVTCMKWKQTFFSGSQTEIQSCTCSYLMMKITCFTFTSSPCGPLSAGAGRWTNKLSSQHIEGLSTMVNPP